MSKTLLSPGRFLPIFIGKVIAHLRNAAKVVEDAMAGLNQPYLLQRATVAKKQHNNRKKTRGRHWYVMNH